jgi:hypothetical protein
MVMIKNLTFHSSYYFSNSDCSGSATFMISGHIAGQNNTVLYEKVKVIPSLWRAHCADTRSHMRGWAAGMGMP